jgi:YVTN family beta-propeller protein
MARHHLVRSVAALALLACTAGHGLEPAPEPEASRPAFPRRGVRFESDGRLLGYVANRRSDTVSVLDLDAMTELGEVPVGRDPVDVDGPRHAVVNAPAGSLYLVLSYPLVADSPHALANGGGPRDGYLLELSLDDLRPLGSVRLAPSPTELALSDDRRLLAVSHQDTVLALKNTTDIDARRASLALVQPSSDTTESAASLALVPTCVAPAAVALSADATRAYVACTGEDTLAVVDTTTKLVTARIPAGTLPANKPYALTRSPAGTRLALSNQVAQTLVVFSTGDVPAPLATIRVSGVPFFAGFLGETELLLPLQEPDGVVRVDLTTGSVVAAVTYPDDSCQNPSDARFTADGRVFLVCEGNHYDPGSVVELDPSTLAIVARAEVGVYPDRLAVLEP